jgi:hypothetical protein
VTAQVPEGYVDPLDRDVVATLLAATQSAMGVEGVADLLMRLPGVRRTAGTPKGFLRPATPDTVWLGPEDAFVLTDPPAYHHVVGGVALHHEPLPPGLLAGVVARLVAQWTVDTGTRAESAAVLTAAREVLDRL